MKESVLENIGFTSGEIKVYLALLDLGKTTIMPLAKESRVTSGKVYGIVDKLIEKGLASFIVENKVKKFSPTSPRRIKDFLDEKSKRVKVEQMELDLILPELEERISFMKENIKVETFIGWSGLKTAYLEAIDGLSENDYNYVIGASKGSSEKQNEIFYYKILKRLIKKNIKIRVLFQGGSDSYSKNVTESEGNVKARYLDNLSPTETTIYGDIVMIIIHSKVPLLIKIKSKELAKSYVDYFKLLWKVAE